LVEEDHAVEEAEERVARLIKRTKSQNQFRFVQEREERRRKRLMGKRKTHVEHWDDESRVERSVEANEATRGGEGQLDESFLSFLASREE